jgi:hypothetical protein
VSEAGKPCTTPAELCGSDRACDLQVLTSPFKQFGSTSNAKRTCLVKADVAIGNLLGACNAGSICGSPPTYLID